MKFFKNILLFVFTTILVSSCVDNSERVLDNGVSLKYFKNGSGKIEENQIVMLNLQYFDHEGNELLNKVGDDPVVLLKDSSWNNNGVIYEIIDNLEEGDSVFFQLTTEKFFENSPNSVSMPDSIKGNLLSFYCGVQNIMEKDEFKNFQREQMEKMQNKMNNNMEEQLIIDTELLDKYLNDNDISTVKTASGLRYDISQEGSGPNAPVGSSVKVHYTGMLLDGTKFDSSVDRGEPFEFNLGQGQVIRGWDEGIGYFNKGAKGTIYIPSALGYGPNGAGGDIPPNAILVFEIELLDF
jgi:FKBP-type peptidyl-prolyl cis-trans isomerase FkpA|tara:strand:+ start:74 stop:958 length:885 start_codon:yes stop_codon:yes gene_type:complete